MNSCILFFKLIRWPNLVIIFLTQWLFQYCVISPLLRSAGLEPQVGVTEFLMIAAAYMLVAAAGYVINDYFDLGLTRSTSPRKYLLPVGSAGVGQFSFIS